MEEKDKKYIPVYELSGKDIVEGAKDIFKDVIGEAKKVIKKGKNCRVVILDKKGEVAYQKPLIASTAGMAILGWAIPLLTFLFALGVLLTEHTIRIEEMVKEEEPAKSESACQEGK